MYLVSCGRLRGTCSRIRRVTSAFRVRPGSRPMPATVTSPAWKRPGPTTRPTFRAWNVTVTAARTAARATSPVEASTPEGRSTETIGRPAAFIASISRAASARGSPWNPVPKSASITTSPSSPSSARRPAERSTSSATSPSPPFLPFPHTAPNERASGKRRSASSATALPARAISRSRSCPSSAARISSAV